MKDLNRKIDRFIKAKAASAKKEKTAKNSPHVTMKVTNFTNSQASTKAGTRGRTFSMTVSFFNPRFDNPYPKDFAIRHQAGAMDRVASGATGRFSSPQKRDPILQNNEEGVKEERATVKCFPTPRSLFEAEEQPLFLQKQRGEFNHVHHARSSSPKIQSIKTYVTLPSDSRDENPKRKLKAVKQVRDSFNPITQGDPESVSLIRQRSPPQISEQTKKINDRMSVLPCERELLSERANSARGRVFWDTGVPFGTCPTEREEPIQQRVGSPKYNRSEGINSLIKYDFALNFRDQGVTDKCTTVAYSERLKFDRELH